MEVLQNGLVELIFVNRDRFIAVVNENITLFRYLISPTMTAEGLLESLLNEKTLFHRWIESHPVLLGIVLGYGAQNAILLCRMNEIASGSSSQGPSMGFVSLDEEYADLSRRVGISSQIYLFPSYTRSS